MRSTKCSTWIKSHSQACSRALPLGVSGAITSSATICSWLMLVRNFRTWCTHTQCISKAINQHPGLGCYCLVDCPCPDVSEVTTHSLCVPLL